MVELWVVLHLAGPNAELGDPRTRKATTTAKPRDAGGSTATSETLASPFNPHPPWVCFSLEATNGRTFDFVATTEVEARGCAGSAPLEGRRSTGWFLWRLSS